MNLVGVNVCPELHPHSSIAWFEYLEILNRLNKIKCTLVLWLELGC